MGTKNKKIERESDSANRRLNAALEHIKALEDTNDKLYKMGIDLSNKLEKAKKDLRSSSRK